MLRVLTSYWKIKIRKYLAPKKYIRHFVIFFVIWYCFNLFIKCFPKGYILSGGTIWVESKMSGWGSLRSLWTWFVLYFLSSMRWKSSLYPMSLSPRCPDVLSSLWGPQTVNWPLLKPWAKICCFRNENFNKYRHIFILSDFVSCLGLNLQFERLILNL